MIDKKHLELFANYLLVNTINNKKTQGYVRRYRSLFGGGQPYPEITGYALTSLTRMYDIYRENKYIKAAGVSADALLRFQTNNGSIPTIIRENGTFSDICHIFDLAIITRGLLDYYERVKDKKYLDAASKALNFIREKYIHNQVPTVVDLTGKKLESSFPSNFWINTKVLIPLYKYYQHISDPSIIDDSEKLSRILIKSFNQNGYFYSKTQVDYNRTHYNAYALYGLAHLHKWKSSKVLSNIIKKGVFFLISLMEESGGIWANYSLEGVPIKKYGFDVPVTAQLGELLIYCQKYKLIKVENRLISSIDCFLTNNVIKKSINKKLIGGLPFYKKNSLFPFTVPWGGEFAINYTYEALNYKNNKQIFY